MKLRELIEAVQEKNLTKTELESYRDNMTLLYARYMLDLADLEKVEARYFLDKPEKSDVATKRAWRGTPDGQLLIQRSREAKALEKVLSSIKSRIFAQY